VAGLGAVFGYDFLVLVVMGLKLDLLQVYGLLTIYFRQSTEASVMASVFTKHDAPVYFG